MKRWTVESKLVMEEVKTGDGLRKSTQASGLEVMMRANK